MSRNEAQPTFGDLVSAAHELLPGVVSVSVDSMRFSSGDVKLTWKLYTESRGFREANSASALLAIIEGLAAEIGNPSFTSEQIAAVRL